jgi:CRP/FNR family transcriptional regulator, anaerobic regulatory protein
MSIERLIQRLSDYHPLSAKFKAELPKHLRLVHLPKGYMLLDRMRVCDQLVFLDKGFAMSYTFENSDKQIEWLWAEGDFIISPVSFFTQGASPEFIEIADHSDVICLSYDAIVTLMVDFRETHFLLHHIVARYYHQSREKTRDLQSITAEARFQKLLTRYKGVEQHLSQEQIASYLGIRAQSLSRIKRLLKR